MKNDVWLRELIQIERQRRDEEHARLDERWDRLSAGELSPDEEADLLRLAETTEEGRQAYEAFRPLGPEFQARVVEAIREGPKPSPSVVQKLLAWLLSFRGRRAAVGGWLTAAAAVAAGLLIIPPGAQPPIPGYVDLDLTGGAQAIRGDEPDAPRSFPGGSQFVLIAKPETAVRGKIDVKCFLARDGELLPWKVPFEVSPNRSVRIAGTVGKEIVIPPGEWTLWVVVGRPGKLPGAKELRARLVRNLTRTPGWVALNARLKAG